MAQECPDAEIGQVTARCGIGFVPDEDFPVSGISAEEPPISVRAAVNLSFPHRHHRSAYDRIFASLNQYHGLAIGCAPRHPRTVRPSSYLQRTRFERIVKRKLRQRQLTDDGNIEISGRGLRKSFAATEHLSPGR